MVDYKGDYFIPEPPPDPSEDEIKKTTFSCRQSALFFILFVLGLLLLLFLEMSGSV